MKYKKYEERKQEIIFIDKNLCNNLNLYFSDRKFNINPLKEFLLSEIKCNDRNNFSVRKLSRKFEETTGLKACNSSIHNYLRNQFGFKYLKTTVKTDKILRKENILISFAFIKIIARCLKQKFNIIYCDETAIQNSTNNYYTWRKSGESFFSNLGPKKRKNLIMAVNDDSVLHYEINDESTNEERFYKFMETLREIILEKKLSPYVIVLDNLSCHKTKKLIELYSSKKMNIIFNTPYLSSFNSIELCFRNIKRFLYTKIYNSIEELIDEVTNYLKEKNFIDGLKSNFSQTFLEKYLLFHENYSSINLNIWHKINSFNFSNSFCLSFSINYFHKFFKFIIF